MNINDQLREIINNWLINLTNNEGLTNFLVSVIMIVFWILLTFIITRFFKFLLLKSKSLEKKMGKEETKEQLTVRRLVNNFIKFFFFFWIGIMILGELGIDLVPLLAGAGVLAFAIGFGAQELIKDVIAGTFLIIEKTFKIGDFVEIGSVSGTVIDVGLRRIKIQTWKGEVITMNNGDIRTIKNGSINPSFAVVEFRADYDFNLKEFDSPEFKAMIEKFKERNPDVLEMPEKILLIDINDGLKFTVNIKTKTRKHVGVEREFRRALIRHFQKRNIDIFVPTMIIDATKDE